MRPIKFRDEFGCVLEFTRRPGTQQFVGVDSAGNEVYEGDILLDELEQEYTAEIYDRPEKIHALKLKEAVTNA